MSTADVVRASGATTGSLYHHFPGGKEELAQAALRLSGAVVEARLEQAFATHATAADALGSWLAELTEQLHDNPLAGCPVAPAALESVHVAPALQAEAASAFQRWTRLLAARLQGDRWPPEQALDVAAVLIAAVEGALVLARTAGSPAALHALQTRLPTLLRR